MKKSILKLGNALNKAEQKQISGGNVFSGPCSEWCADPYLQEIYWKPLFCNCNIGGGGNGGDPIDPSGPVGPV